MNCLKTPLQMKQNWKKLSREKQMNTLIRRNSELLSYICHKTGIDKKELISEIKSKYKNLDEMKADLK